MSSLTYTYTWQAQPYVPWKGAATNSAVPTYSRPLQKNETQQNGPSFSARPIKHWRKQLNPQPHSGRGRPGVGMPMDVPGGSVYLGTDSSDCVVCGQDGSSNSTGLKNNILRDNGQRAATAMMGNPGSLLLSDASSAVHCIACNPENNIIKSGVTLLNKKYYSDTRGYLQSRCMRYDQKLSINDMSGISYFGPNGEILWPENSKNSGPQIRASMNCPKNCTPADGRPTVSNIYKPSNRQYANQGAVSSGSRITRLKYNTITKNGNSFRTAWGEQGANAGKYRGTPNAPYFLKSKNQSCIPNIRNRRPGNHTFCFYTPTGSVGHTALTTMV
jgi:hypothetical protein